MAIRRYVAAIAQWCDIDAKILSRRFQAEMRRRSAAIRRYGAATAWWSDIDAEFLIRRFKAEMQRRSTTQRCDIDAEILGCKFLVATQLFSVATTKRPRCDKRTARRFAVTMTSW